MKIAKAIEHLNAIKDSGEYLGDPDDSRALKLGIEALKRLQIHRTEHIDIGFNPLPGETED